MLKSLKKADVEMVSYRKTLFNKNRMPNTESHIYNNFQMGIFSRSSDRNGQFSVMFMLLHFLVYFSTVSFHSISVSLCLPYELSPASFHRLDLPMHGVFYCTHSYTCHPHYSPSIPSSPQFGRFFPLSHTGPVWAVVKARASSCFIHIIL